MDAKGAKRNVKMWATKFYHRFFKNILFYMNGGLSQIRSVHTYVLKGFILVISTVSSWYFWNFLDILQTDMFYILTWYAIFPCLILMHVSPLWSEGGRVTVWWFKGELPHHSPNAHFCIHILLAKISNDGQFQPFINHIFNPRTP